MEIPSILAAWGPLLETLPLGAILTDAAGRFVEANAEACRILGMDRHDLLSSSCLDPRWMAIGSDGTRLPAGEFPGASALPSGTPVRRQMFGMARDDGGTRWLEVSAGTLPGGGGVLTFDDASDRHRGQALDDDEKYLHEARHLAGIGIWQWTTATDTVQWTRELFEITGRDPELGAPSFAEMSSCYTAESWERLSATVASAMADGTPYEIDLEMVRPDGTRRHTFARGQASLDASGKIVGLHGTVQDITERKRAEAALRESEALFNTAFQFMPVAFGITIMKDGRFLAANKAFQDITGYSAEELVGQSSLQHRIWATPEDRAAVVALLLAGKPVYDLETRFRHKDGSLRWCSYSAQMVNLDGVPCLLSGSIDITERKEAKEQLLKRERQLRESQEVAKIGSWTLDVPGNTVEWSEETFRRFDQDPANFTPWRGYLLNRVHPEDLAAIQDSMKEALENDASYHAVARIINESGRQWVMEAFGFVERDEDGKPLRFSGTIQDITQRMRDEKGLREAWAAVEQSPVSIVITDTSGEMEYVNPAFTETTGYSREEVLRGNFRLLESGEQSSEFNRGIWDTLAQGQTWKGRLHNRRKDGEFNWEQATISPLRDAHGEITHYLAFMENITEALRLEEEHRQLEQQMARTQKLESLGSLAGGVAHDMNNVLGAILALASVHQMQAPEGTVLRSSMDTITNACMRGRTLVQGLLGFARQGLSEEKNLDLNTLVREEVALLERTTLQKVSLEVDLAVDLRSVKGDPSALSQALMNLCLNAVDAMPEGGTLSLRTRNEGLTQVLLEVCDSGCGMPSEVLDKALDPFFTTKPHGKGTGLGLPIVYGTVKAHRGRMDLRSSPGQGTTVAIRLPASQVPRDPAQCMETAPPAIRSLRVLVVDDDELVQQSIGQLLDALGHLPTVVARGEEALARLDAGLDCDVVILDLNMPGLGGAATLPQLRSLRPDLPVLLATGRAGQEAMDLVRTVPRVVLMPKPFSLADLRRNLGELG